MPDSKVLSPSGKRRPPNAGKGRVKGVPNKFTSSVKEAVKAAFDQIQGDPAANLVTWAKANPTEFYRLAAKLIPAAVDATVTGTVEFSRIERVIVRPPNPDG